MSTCSVQDQWAAVGLEGVEAEVSQEAMEEEEELELEEVVEEEEDSRELETGSVQTRTLIYFLTFSHCT